MAARLRRPQAQARHLRADEADALHRQLGLHRVPGASGLLGLTATHWQRWQARVLQAVDAWHAARPDSLGPDEQALRQALRLPSLARPAYAALTAVWAQTQADSDRLKEMGAPVRAVVAFARACIALVSLPPAVRVAAPPAALQLPAYYKKYLDASGVKIRYIDTGKGEAIVASTDKDLHCLIAQGALLWDPFKGVWHDAAWVEAKWGVAPAQLADLLALMGDPADAIPGVSGVGVKTAARLLRTYGTAAPAAGGSGSTASRSKDSQRCMFRTGKPDHWTSRQNYGARR